ncbi:hypothetical protein ACTFIU_000392 [Dictyostelium citrinum]
MANVNFIETKRCYFQFPKNSYQIIIIANLLVSKKYPADLYSILTKGQDYQIMIDCLKFQIESSNLFTHEIKVGNVLIRVKKMNIIVKRGGWICGCLAWKLWPADRLAIIIKNNYNHQ